MALWYIPGQGIVDDAEEGAHIPEPGSFTLPDGSQITWGIAGTEKLPEYTLPAQFGATPFQWRPGAHTQEWLPGLSSYAVGYIPQLIDWGEASRAGTLQDVERQQYEQMVQQARAIPTRDWTQLQAGYPGEAGDWSRYLTPSSPDAGAIMLQLDDRIRSGQASGQERQLFDTFLAQMRDQDYRASVPQASDAFNPLGDQFFSALGVLGLGATGGLAAAPLVAGGAGLATTLGSVGTLAGIAGTGAGVLGQALDQPWLRNVGLGLGIAGGLAGGIGGLTNVFSGGINSVADAARLAQSAGRVTGALGRIPGAGPLQQASRYLGLAGQLGRGFSGVQGLLGAAEGVTEGAGPVAQPAQSLPWTPSSDLVTQRGGTMSEWDWLNLDLGSGEGYGTVLAPGWDSGGGGGGSAWEMFTGWGDPYGPGSSGDVGFTDSAGGGGFLSSLGGLGGALGSLGGFLGNNASWLGPAVSGLAGLGAGAMGSHAANDAARLQASALNRGLDLQTAQWLQQQANQAPWLQAGQEALGHMRGRATWDQPTLQQTGPISGANYALPSATPGWSPQSYAGYTPVGTPQAGDYRWTPGQGPRAADYRYTPGAVPTLSGQELLANDPGVAFRLQEGRQALEASAAARGGALSGPALAALQRQGQALSSQEYGNAWQRAASQAQMREQWQQYATQQGWSQAQAEAAFREQLASQASSQNWGQAAQEAQLRAQQQQFGWTAGMQAQQAGSQEQQNWWNQLYGNQMQQNQLQYGRDWQQREAENQRMMDAYNALRQGQGTAWNQFASLAGTGQTALGQLGTGGQGYANSMGTLLGQMGTAQGQGALSSGNSWLNALQNMGTAAQGAFGNMQFQNQLSSLLAGLNR